MNTLLLFGFGRLILGAFTDNPHIIAVVIGILALDLILQPLKMWNMPLGNSLNAVGDTQYVMKVGIVAMWFVAVGGTYLLGIQPGWLLHGVYIAMIMDEGIRGFLVQRRWIAGKRLPRESGAAAAVPAGGLQM